MHDERCVWCVVWSEARLREGGMAKGVNGEIVRWCRRRSGEEEDDAACKNSVMLTLRRSIAQLQ